jgi:hypothetical protein
MKFYGFICSYMTCNLYNAALIVLVQWQKSHFQRWKGIHLSMYITSPTRRSRDWFGPYLISWFMNACFLEAVAREITILPIFLIPMF